MDNDTLNRRVWEEMVAANMRANYFADFVHLYQERDKFFRIASLVLASGAVASAIVAVNNPLVRITAPIIAAIVGAWLQFGQYSMLSRDAADLMVSWQSVAGKYEKLWNNLYEGGEQRFDEIYKDADALSKPGSKFPRDDEKLGMWLDRTLNELNSRYAQPEPSR